jgi:hypothetical protein
MGLSPVTAAPGRAVTTDLVEVDSSPSAPATADVAPAPAALASALDAAQPRTRPPEPGGALPRWRPLLRPVRYYLASRLLVLGAAVVAAVLYPSLDIVRSFGSVWDGRWYLLIAQHGYPDRMYQEGLGSRWAFFPAFPAAIRGVAEVTRLSLPDAAFLAAFVFGLTGTVAVWLVVRETFGARLADRATLLLVFFPLSCILSFAYTEGLFLTVAAGTLYALQRRWWVTAALLASVAGLTRNTGAVVVVCVLVVALPAAWRERRVRPLVAAGIAPLGLVAFMAYSWAMVGTPFAFLTSQRFWQGQHFVWFSEPVRALAALLTLSVHGLTLAQAAFCTVAVVFAYAGVVCLLSLSRERRVPSSWWVYTVGAIAVAFSAYFTNSIPRYTLVAFPLFVGIAWKARSITRTALLVGFASVQAVLTVVFLTGVVHPLTPPFFP